MQLSSVQQTWVMTQSVGVKKTFLIKLDGLWVLHVCSPLLSLRLDLYHGIYTFKKDIEID